MKRMALSFFLVMIMIVPALATGENNASRPDARPAQDQVPPTQAAPAVQDSPASGKIPLDIQSKGVDSSGTLLSYKLKEEIIASKLFELKVAEKKKFVLHTLTQPEFPDRPGLASIYSLVLVYQEDVGTLAYYLDQYQGQVHAESVGAEMQKILEWSYAVLKRYHYLLDE